MTKGPRFTYWKGVFADMMERAGYSINPRDIDSFADILVQAEYPEGYVAIVGSKVLHVEIERLAKELETYKKLLHD